MVYKSARLSEMMLPARSAPFKILDNDRQQQAQSKSHLGSIAHFLSPASHFARLLHYMGALPQNSDVKKS
jgi:hypothetical protein